MNWLEGGSALIVVSLVVFVFVLIRLILKWRSRSGSTQDELAPYVHVNATWGPHHFNEFLNNCNNERLNSLKNYLETKEMCEPDDNKLISEIKKEVLKQSSHFFTFHFKDYESIDYHKVVKWVAEKCSVPKDQLESSPTFKLEKLIMEASFRDIWDCLSAEQRYELIEKIDTQNVLNKYSPAELATMTGTAALATLSTSVYFTGFAFYTTMSTVICSVAGFFGVTLPFSTYMGASTTVAALSGPIGWALLAIGAAGSLVFLGKANWKKSMAFIVKMHCLKVEALQAR